MIIAVCLDDQDIYEEAAKQSLQSPAVYGQTYRIFSARIPTLGHAENLFITAHGTEKGAHGAPEIGNHEDTFGVSAPELWENIKDIFPNGYSGSVYVSTCESADGNEKLFFSFVDLFKQRAKESGGIDIRVFGQQGEIDYEIPKPGDKKWVEARG